MMQVDTATLIQWERAKGELRALVVACQQQDDDVEASEEINNSVQNMIDEVDGLIEGER
ncbi:hypothetical protein H7849_11740 [Alloacidobacterium dinghuense]|uniref:Uncharacterized protein n=1 Tax=Alloacidobacterium dinghuense TaxID=2763107 RepID=A0A7G8BPM7_9BACT|nr:hypothetical protein [Alloacidobacterium dinghuense]QNI34497.1 hypothetical protein H7849_11740 [Alloacidobacterium dinghuense]